MLKDGMSLVEIASFMANADLGIIPKRNDPFGGEAFSTKTLEFMSLGVPIIVTKTKIDSFYFNESIVKFAEPENVDDLAACMRLMIENGVYRDRQIREAQKFVAAMSWDKRKDEYLGLVDHLVGSK